MNVYTKITKGYKAYKIKTRKVRTIMGVDTKTHTWKTRKEGHIFSRKSISCAQFFTWIWKNRCHAEKKWSLGNWNFSYPPCLVNMDSLSNFLKSIASSKGKQQHPYFTATIKAKHIDCRAKRPHWPGSLKLSTFISNLYVTESILNEYPNLCYIFCMQRILALWIAVLSRSIISFSCKKKPKQKTTTKWPSPCQSLSNTAQEFSKVSFKNWQMNSVLYIRGWKLDGSRTESLSSQEQEAEFPPNTARQNLLSSLNVVSPCRLTQFVSPLYLSIFDSSPERGEPPDHS